MDRAIRRDEEQGKRNGDDKSAATIASVARTSARCCRMLMQIRPIENTKGPLKIDPIRASRCSWPSIGIPSVVQKRRSSMEFRVAIAGIKQGRSSLVLIEKRPRRGPTMEAVERG